MAHQSQTSPKLNPIQSIVREVAPRVKALQLLSAAIVALFLVAPVRADILVSNYNAGTVDKYNDDGTINKLGFLSGATTAEGVQCVKLTSNEVYVASVGSPMIRVYDLTTGLEDVTKDFMIKGATSIISLAIGTDPVTGIPNVLYAADPFNTHPTIWAVSLPIGSGPCPPNNPANNPCSVHTQWSFDVVVDPVGNVDATNRRMNSIGVRQFSGKFTSTGWSHGSGTPVIPGGSYAGHSLANAGAMIFDTIGNLWVNNSDQTSGGGGNDGIFEFTGPQNSNPYQVLNFTADPNALPLGMDISPVNPAGPPVDPCKGCIVVAEFLGKPGTTAGDVDQIDPTSCTGTTINNPGTCKFYASTPFIVPTTGRPKYVRFTENCNDSGYFEVCKMSCLTDPVKGNFTFTATNSGFSSGPLTVPVNACSGPVQMPNGTITIQETQQLGTEVTGIAAYNYDYLGDQINALLSSNFPFATGNIDVVSGDISTETVAGFTNCASGPGELKICKVAGTPDLMGEYFSFTATASGSSTTYSVPAGPAPGGYCVVATSYPVGTPVLVKENAPYFSPFEVSGITVAPADRGGTQTPASVIAIIDSGTTEVTFTNTTVPAGCVWVNEQSLLCAYPGGGGRGSQLTPH